MTNGRNSASLNAMSANPIANNVGLNIRAEMGRQRVSMSELGRRTGIPRSTLAHQMDVSAVTVGNLVLIAQALSVDPSDLLPEPAGVAS